jgi:hypothetical protein
MRANVHGNGKRKPDGYCIYSIKNKTMPYETTHNPPVGIDRRWTNGEISHEAVYQFGDEYRIDEILHR